MFVKVEILGRIVNIASAQRDGVVVEGFRVGCVRFGGDWRLAGGRY